MRKITALLLAIACSFLMSSCSVIMASEKKGANLEDIERCQTRTCLMNLGASVISQKKNKNDVLTEELMQVQKPVGSTARAVMHGTLDVATLGMWEVAGMPMEAVMSQPNRYSIIVAYQKNGENIKSIRLVK